MEETSIDSWLYKPEADFLVEMQACARELNNGMKTPHYLFVWILQVCLTMILKSVSSIFNARKINIFKC